MTRKIYSSLFALILISCQLVSTSHAAPYAYIANYFGNTVSVIDLASKTVTADIVVDHSPLAVAINPSGTRAYVTNTGDNTVSVIDTTSNTELKKITGFTGLNFGGIAISPDGEKGYVTGYESGNVYIIDTSSDTINDTLTGFTNPNGVAFSPDGSKAYISNHTANTISVIDTSTDTVAGTPIPVDNYPGSLVTNPSGTRLYVLCGKDGENSIVSINTATNETVSGERIVLDDNGYSWGLAINPAGTKLYATQQLLDKLKVVDIASHSVEATIETGLSHPLGVSVTPDGSQIVVVNASNNSVAIIDSATLANTTVTGFNSPWSFGDFIASPPPVTDGLIAFWRGEGNAFDVVGNNNGTLQGGASFAVAQVGQAFSFDGADDYVSIANESNFDFDRNAPFSIDGWVKTSASSSGDIFSKYQSSTPYTGYQLVITNGGQIHFYLICSWVDNVLGVRTTSTVNDGNFHHITVTYDGSSHGAGVSIYVDGVSQPLTIIYDTLTGSILNDVNPTISKNLSGNYFNGLIDELGVFNRALSPSEASKLAGTYPDAFGFPAKTNVELDTLTESDAISISGITQPAPISIADGEYQINGGAWTSSPGTVPLGATVKVHQTSSSDLATTTTTTLTIGGREETFAVTTALLLLNPVTSSTNLVSQSVGGTVKSGAAVTVSVNGSAHAASVTGTTWSYDINNLARGDNGIVVTATDTGYTPTTRSVTINCIAPRLTVTVTGTVGLSGAAGGTVTSDPAGISCTAGPCSALFDGGLPVTLMATPDGNSIFGGWSGDLVAADKTSEIQMGSDSSTGDRNVTATFTYVEPAKIQSTGDLYPHIRDAYNALTGNGAILARKFLFDGDLTLGNGYAVILRGGFNPEYSSNSDYSTIRGKLTIGTGSLTVERIIVSN